jgi:hypothetical protein
MEKLSEHGEKYRRILTYFLKKKGIYKIFVANTKYRHSVIDKRSVFFKRQYYNGIFNQAVWDNNGLVNLFGDFFAFTSAKYPERIEYSDGTTKDSNIFSRYEFWVMKRSQWEDFIYKREYEEITTLK